MEAWTLENCPICGAGEVLMNYDAMYEDLPMMPVMPWYVKCLSCGALAFGETPEKAAYAWNGFYMFEGKDNEHTGQV